MTENLSFSGFCNACCFSCCCLNTPPSTAVYRVLCLGITNAGKTTLLAVLMHENTDVVVPTIGFNVKDIRIGNVILNVKELGGGDDIRQFWSRYYDGVEAVIFVIDGLCTHVELEKTRKELFNALEDPSLRAVPWLILCNKQDVDGASTHHKVIEELDLDSVLQSNTNIVVKSCSKTNRDELIDIFESFSNLLKRFYQDRGDVGNRI